MKTSFAYYVCCIYSNALQKLLLWKQSLWTLIRLLREQSDLGNIGYKGKQADERADDNYREWQEKGQSTIR